MTKKRGHNFSEFFIFSDDKQYDAFKVTFKGESIIVINNAMISSNRYLLKVRLVTNDQNKSV